MNIKFIDCNLLNSTCQVLAHQINSFGVWENNTVAKAIKEKYPEVYKEYMQSWEILEGDLFGGELFVKTKDGKYVANITSQYYCKGVDSEYNMLIKTNSAKAPQLISGVDIYPGVPLRFTNYEALYRGLNKTKRDMLNNDLTSIAFPKNMGSGEDGGGGSWEIILAMIKETFSDTPYTIEICNNEK